MPETPRLYRFRVWDGTGTLADFRDPAIATGNLLNVSSVATDTAPYIAAPPSGGGREIDPQTGKPSVGQMTVSVIDAETDEADEGLMPLALQSPGTDDSTAGWTSTVGAIATRAANPAPKVGTAYLYGGDNSAAMSAYQDVAIPAEHHAAVDAGTVTAYLLGWLGGYMTQTDTARMRLTALDGVGGTPLGTDADTGAVDAPHTWTSRTLALALPAGTRALRVTLEAVRHVGLNCDGYFNGLELSLAGVGAVVTAPGRVVTRRLADAAARWQMLSRPAVIEVSEDGETFETLHSGYINRYGLTGGLVYEFTVGDSERVESQVELFRDADPERLYNDGTVLEAPGAIIGGPIVSGTVAYGQTPREVFGGEADHGPCRFVVTSLTGAPARQLTLTFQGGYLRPYFAAPYTKIQRDEERAINNYARHYFTYDSETFKSDPGQNASSFGYHGGLVVRLRSVSDPTKVWYRTPIAVPVPRRTPSGGQPTGLYDALVDGKGQLRVDWPDPSGGGVTDIAGRALDATADARPSVGTQFDVEVWPVIVSEQARWHEKGPPVTLLTRKLDAIGETYDAASAAAIATAINAAFGGDVTVELVHDGPLTLREYKHLLFAFFGFTERRNADGALEFIPTRAGVDVVGTITADDLREPGRPHEVDEQSIVTRVELEGRSLQSVRPSGLLEDFSSEFNMDGLTTARQTVVGKADTLASTQRTARFALPGRVLVDGKPVTSDAFVAYAAAVGTFLVDWLARGLPEAEFKCLPSVTAQVGDDVMVDLPHLPVPVVGAEPVTQRGQAPRRFRVVKRTETPSGPDLKLVDAPPADLGSVTAPPGDPVTTPPEVPDLAFTVDFTLAQSAEDPARIATVTIDSDLTFAGTPATARFQFATGPSEPVTAGVEIGGMDHLTGTTLDTPAAQPGTTVWVRARPYLGDAPVGAWGAWVSVTLSTAGGITVPPPALSYEIAEDGDVTVLATLTSPAAAVRIVAGAVDGAAPTEAEVLLGTLITSPPFEVPDIVTLEAGERVVVSAIAEDADGRTSSLTSVTVVRGAGGALEELDPDPSGVYTRASVQVDAYGRVVDAESGPEDGIPAGGTTGQALLKASDTDYDAVWANLPSGGGGGWQTETREVAQAVGSYTEIAEINIDGSGGSWRAGTVLVALHIVATGYSATALYIIPMEYLLASRDWEIANPLVWGRYDAPARGGRLEVRRLTGSTNTLQLRAVQTGGYGAFTAIAQIQVLASTTFTITPLSGTGISTASRQFGPLTPIRQTVKRTLASTVGNYVEIGSWSGIDGGIVLRVSVTLPSNANKRTALTYIVAAASDTPTGWREVPPVAMSTPYSNRQTVLEADVTSGVLSLRLRHSAGSFSGDHIVVMEMLNLEHPSIDGAPLYTATPQFTPSAGTGTSGVTATTTPWDVGDRVPVRVVSSAYTASTGDRCIIADTTSASFTITLPAPNEYHVRGQRIYIKNKGSNNLTLDPAGSAQIDGATTKVLSAGASVVAICSGTDWQTW